METFTVEGKIREGRGKGPARRTQLTGMVPSGSLRREKGISFAGGERQAKVAKILRSESGHNTIFTVAGGGRQRRKSHAQGLAGGSGERRAASCGPVPNPRWTCGCA